MPLLSRRTGFTSPEVITALVVVAVLAALVIWLTNAIREEAVETSKARNAAALVDLISSLRSSGLQVTDAGGTPHGFFRLSGGAATLGLSPDPAANTDAVIDLLTALAAGVTLSGVTFRLNRVMTPGSYRLARLASNEVAVTAVPGPEHLP